MEMEPRPCEVKDLQDFFIYVKFNNGEETGEDITPENLYNDSEPIESY